MCFHLQSIDAISSSSDYYKEIAPRVWLMASHRWAFWAWESYRDSGGVDLPCALAHIDYHWDAVDDWQTQERIDFLRNLSAMSQIKELLIEGENGRSKVQHDNFIAPAIIRGLIDEVHFYCLFYDNPTLGFYEPHLKRHSGSQQIHENIESLVEHVADRPVFVDLDIDIFNRSGKWADDENWSEQEILSFLSKCEGMIRRALVVTVAMSFGYSGTDSDTKRIAKLVVSEILGFRGVRTT